MNIPVDLTAINWLSVIVVTLLSFPLGSAWHSKLFGKAWKEDARPVFDGSKKINFIKLFGFSAVMHFMAIAGLDLVIGIQSTWISGLLTGAAVSVFWVFTTFAVTHSFAGRTFRLILIDAGFYVLLFAAGGSILGAW